MPVPPVTPLPRETVEVVEKTKGLKVTDWVIRPKTTGSTQEVVHTLEAILRNDSWSVMKDLECELRYFDAHDKLLGIDGSLLVGNDEMPRGSDKGIVVELTVPPLVRRAQFIAKAQPVMALQRNSFLLFGIVILIASLLSVFGDLIKKLLFN